MPTKMDSGEGKPATPAQAVLRKKRNGKENKKTSKVIDKKSPFIDNNKIPSVTAMDENPPERKTTKAYKAIILMWKALMLVGKQTQSQQNTFKDWGEKSVEYKFVREVLPGEAIANPLFGDSETLFGDLIAGEIIKGGTIELCAIEFKRTEHQIEDEYEKFLRTRKEFGTRPANTSFRKWFSEKNIELNKLPGSAAHFFIYGETTNDSVHPFSLKCCSYAAGGSVIYPLEKFSTLTRVGRDDLIRYLILHADARMVLPGNPILANAEMELLTAHFESHLKSMFVCSEEGDCIAAMELIAAYEYWLEWQDRKNTNMVDAMTRSVVIALEKRRYKARDCTKEIFEQVSKAQDLIRTLKAELQAGATKEAAVSHGATLNRAKKRRAGNLQSESEPESE